MTEPGERPSGATKEQIDKRIGKIKDPIERKRLQTIANITDPLIRHKKALDLTDEQLIDLRMVAVKAGELEASRLKEFLGKGMVCRLDALFEKVVQEHSEYLSPLGVASLSVRREIDIIKNAGSKSGRKAWSF